MKHSLRVNVNQTTSRRAAEEGRGVLQGTALPQRVRRVGPWLAGSGRCARQLLAGLRTVKRLGASAGESGSASSLPPSPLGPSGKHESLVTAARWYALFPPLLILSPPPAFLPLLPLPHSAIRRAPPLHLAGGHSPQCASLQSPPSSFG